MCVNSDGYATCECKAGYKGDGAECVDIDECTEEGELKHECDE